MLEDEAGAAFAAGAGEAFAGAALAWAGAGDRGDLGAPFFPYFLGGLKHNIHHLVSMMLVSHHGTRAMHAERHKSSGRKAELSAYAC